MVFSSVTFLFLYLPIVLLVYHLVFFLPITFGSRRTFWWRASNAFLLAASLIFYFWGEKWRVWIFIATTFFDYLCALAIGGRPSDAHGRKSDRTPLQRAVLILSIVSNLSILAYFKYFNFVAESYNSLITSAGYGGWRWEDVPAVALPLGISFFTFHSMSYVIDVYRGDIKPTRNFIDYACYVLMFPQLVAGPIVRFSYVAESLVSRTVTLRYLGSGVSRFVIGLGKKVLIANTAATAADQIFALQPQFLTCELAWLGIAAYTIQIYFDFSGYSDMAIGLGRMLGFELPENFNFPYSARSLREFWRRWHMSLSTWFQDYVYIPLGGSRGSAVTTCRNLFLVFFLCGLWHGASWTFVAWGLYHGLFLSFERTPAVSRTLGRAGAGTRLYTMLVVMGGWVLFRADSFSHAGLFYRALVGLHTDVVRQPIEFYASADVITALIVGCIFSSPYLLRLNEVIQSTLSAAGSRQKWILGGSMAAVRVVSLILVLGASCLALSAGTHNPFIYFRF